MKIIVTGGSGFVGQELIKILLERGHNVVNIDINPSGLEGIYEFVHDLTTVPIHVDGDFCFHLASGAGGLLYNQRSNVISYNKQLNLHTSSICNSMPVLFISTLNVYEGCKSLNEDMNPSTPYAKSKMEGEKIFESGYIVRPPNIFGKSQIDQFTEFGESHVIPDILKKIETCDEVEIWGDGTQKRNFLHVKDLCKYLVTFLSGGYSRSEYNVGSSLTISIKELVNELMLFSNKNVPIKFNESYMKYEKMFVEDILSELNVISTISSIQEGLLK